MLCGKTNPLDLVDWEEKDIFSAYTDRVRYFYDIVIFYPYPNLNTPA